VEPNEPLAEIGEHQEMEANEQDTIANHGLDDRQHSVSSLQQQEIQQLQQEEQPNNHIKDDSSS
jgi:hypothetical protein